MRATEIEAPFPLEFTIELVPASPRVYKPALEASFKPQIAVEFFAAPRTQQARERLSLGLLYDDHDLVCPGPGGKPWPPDNLSTAFAAFVRRSEIKHLRFHDLRHTHATQLLKEGVHPKVVSERLGHSTVAITLDTYSHVLPGMQKDAVARLDTTLRSALARGSET